MASPTALSWRSELTDDEVAAARTVIDAATAADGRPPVSEAVRLRVRPGPEPAAAPAAAHLLASAGPDSAVVGYAHLAHDGPGGAWTAELAVHPEHRGYGIGAELVRALLDRAGDDQLRVWAHGEHPAAAALAERYGFGTARVLWQLRRRLDGQPLPRPRFPDGVTVRPFAVGRDEAAFVEVNNKAFAWHPEQGRWTVDDVRLREAEPWFDPDGFLIATEAASGAAAEAASGAVPGDGTGRIVGFHWTKIHEPGLGEVYVLGVDPVDHGRGLGTALTLAGLHHLAGRGVETVLLYVEADNDKAVRTYQRLGFISWESDVCYLHRTVTVT